MYMKRFAHVTLPVLKIVSTAFEFDASQILIEEKFFIKCNEFYSFLVILLWINC